MSAVDEASAEALLSSLRTIDPAERRKHASVYNYWLSIRGSRDFPPIHDLDPLELSDAGAHSVLLEMVGGGEDAEIRHIGRAVSGGSNARKVSEASSPSLLSCIATRLPVVAACRDAFAFEDEFETADGKTRCWVSLFPFSATGTWIDFVYGFVTLDGASVAEAAEPELAEEPQDLVAEAVSEELPEPFEAPAEAAEPPLAESTAEAESLPVHELAEDFSGPEPMAEAELEPEMAEATRTASIKPGFSKKFLETLATMKGFYGSAVEVELDPDSVEFECGETPAAEAQEEPESRLEPQSEPEVEPEAAVIPEAEQSLEVEPEAEPEAATAREAEQPLDLEPGPDAEPSDPPTTILEGTLESKLTNVRAKADEARQAKLRANAALYEGLSAAYDFALDAEDAPEEYLKLVQAEGLKIQLRSPMRPVAKLAFDGMCDEMTIKQLEAVLAWAFEEELPRGTLAERIEAAGGIGPILNGEAKAA